MDTDSERIIREATEVLKESRSTVVELSAPAVAVLGDARFYGPTIIVRFNPRLTMEEIGALATRIVNEVKGLSRVLAEVPHEKKILPFVPKGATEENARSS